MSNLRFLTKRRESFGFGRGTDMPAPITIAAGIPVEAQAYEGGAVLVPWKKLLLPYRPEHLEPLTEEAAGWLVGLG